MATARHARPKELEGVPIDTIIERYVARFADRKADWAAFEDAKIEGFKRAQHRFIGAGGSGKHGDTSSIPAGNFTLSIMIVPASHHVAGIFRWSCANDLCDRSRRIADSPASGPQCARSAPSSLLQWKASGPEDRTACSGWTDSDRRAPRSRYRARPGRRRTGNRQTWLLPSPDLRYCRAARQPPLSPLFTSLDFCPCVSPPP